MNDKFKRLQMGYKTLAQGYHEACKANYDFFERKKHTQLRFEDCTEESCRWHKEYMDRVNDTK